MYIIIQKQTKIHIRLVYTRVVPTRVYTKLYNFKYLTFGGDISFQRLNNNNPFKFFFFLHKMPRNMLHSVLLLQAFGMYFSLRVYICSHFQTDWFFFLLFSIRRIFGGWKKYTFFDKILPAVLEKNAFRIRFQSPYT